MMLSGIKSGAVQGLGRRASASAQQRCVLPLPLRPSSAATRRAAARLLPPAAAIHAPERGAAEKDDSMFWCVWVLLGGCILAGEERGGWMAPRTKGPPPFPADSAHCA